MLVLTAILIVIATSIGVFLLLIFKNRKQYNHILSPPIPNAREWVFGHLPDIKRIRAANPNIVFIDLVNRYLTSLDTRTITLYFFHRCVVFTKDVDIASVILGNNVHFNKDKNMNDSFNKLAGVRFLGRQGILTNPGDSIWYQKRKIMDNAFHKKSIHSTFKGMYSSANKLIDLLNNTIKENEIINLYSLLGSAALDVIVNTGFSIEQDVLTSEKSYILEAINNIFIGMGTFFRNQQTFNLPWCYVDLKKTVAKDLTYMRSYLKEHLEKRLHNDEEMTKKTDILSYIIKANQSIDGFGIEEIIDEFFVFFVAGMETTSNTMSFFLLNVVKDKSVYDKLEAEVDEVFSRCGDLDYEAVSKLVYLEQCIKESLRVYSVAESTGRILLKDCLIKDLFLPKGTIVGVSQSLIQRDKEYWGENAEKFDPDNFAPDRVIKPFTYMPFMVGPRSCIGKHFAMLEMKVVLAKLIRSFKFRDPYPEDKGRIITRSDVTQKPVNGVPMFVTPR